MTSLHAMTMNRVLLRLLLPLLLAGRSLPAAEHPNVLFIALDDQNDWIGCFGGNPQTRTPNLDRLGASGVVFENAYCPGAACNPSRSALFTGIPCHRSGLYSNRQQMREVLPDAQIIPHYFSRNGYWSAGSGKMLHYFIDAPSWDDYYPDKEREDPFPPWLKFGQRPKSLPRASDWQYVETDWGAFDVSDADFQGNYLVTEWVSKQLAAPHDKPFFLACGIYRPHEPWFVPKKYLDMFPLESIRMPPGLKEGDLDDVPPAGQKRGRNRYLDHIKAQGQWKQGIQAYLACVAYADAMVGRVLDALERSPYRDNTIVILWGDNGFHLGEKEHWQKYTGWRQTARIPLIIRVPKGAPGLVDGTPAGARCSRPVNLLDLYRTLTDLCGLPEKPGTYGHNLVPLLKNPQAPWPYPSITHLDQPDSYAISTEDWRYVHYAEGGEELYDIQSDLYELRNLADRAELAGVLQKMRGLAPENRAPLTSATLPNPALTWVPAADGPCPPSRASTNAVMVAFTNYSGRNIRLYRIDAAGNKKSFGMLTPIKTQRVQTYTGQVWLVTDEQDKALGHFVAGAESARAEIESTQ